MCLELMAIVDGPACMMGCRLLYGTIAPALSLNKQRKHEAFLLWAQVLPDNGWCYVVLLTATDGMTFTNSSHGQSPSPCSLSDSVVAPEASGNTHARAMHDEQSSTTASADPDRVSQTAGAAIACNIHKSEEAVCTLAATHAGPVHDSHRAGYHPLAESIETLNRNEQPGSTRPPIVQSLDGGGDPRHASTTEDGPFPYNELITSGQSGGSSINYRGLEHKTDEPHQDRLPTEHEPNHRGNMARLFPASRATEASRSVQYPSADDKPPWGTTAPEPLHEGVPDLPESQEQMPLQLFSGYVSYEQLEVVVVGRRRDPAEGLHWVRMRGPGGYFGPVPSTSRFARART